MYAPEMGRFLHPPWTVYIHASDDKEELTHLGDSEASPVLSIDGINKAVSILKIRGKEVRLKSTPVPQSSQAARRSHH